MKFKIKSILSATLLLIIVFWFTGCGTKNMPGKITIPLIEYSQDDRDKLADTLDEINRPIVDKFIGDYKNLRDKVRALNTG